MSVESESSRRRVACGHSCSTSAASRPDAPVPPASKSKKVMNVRPMVRAAPEPGLHVIASTRGPPSRNSYRSCTIVKCAFQNLLYGRCVACRGPRRLIAPKKPALVPKPTRLTPLWPVRHARYSDSLVMRRSMHTLPGIVPMFLM